MAKKRNPALLAKKNVVPFSSKPVVLTPVNGVKKVNVEKSPVTAVKKPAPKVVPTPAPISMDEDNFSLSLNTTVGSAADRVRTAEKLQRKSLSQKQRKELLIEKKAAAFKNNELKLERPGQKQFKPPREKEWAPIDTPKAFKVRDALQGADETKTTEVAAESVPIAPKVNAFAPKPKVVKEKPKKMSSLFKNNPEVPIVGQRLVKPVNETVFTGASMSSIGLHDHAVKNMADILKITELTTVQQRTVPVVLSGRDVLVRSQTGSGKTLAFALPIVQKLQEIRPKLTRDAGIQALIIVPTRELAIQVYELFVKLLKPFTWIVSSYLSGGEKRKAEKARLRKGINILVGTPGRLVDHLLHTESFKLDQVQWLVLDEADRLFELGYEIDVKKIVDVLNAKPSVAGGSSVVVSAEDKKNPFAKIDKNAGIQEIVTGATGDSKLQSVLLSATLTASVRQLAGLTLKNPLYIDTSDCTEDAVLKSNTFKEAIDEAVADETIVIPATVAQSYILVPPKLRLVTLAGLIAVESKKPSKILVFLGTENLVDFHYDLMIETLTKKVLDADDDDEEALDEDENEDDDGEPPILGGVRFFR